MWVAFAIAKATHVFFNKNISMYAIFNNPSFNNTLTNDIVSFKQLGPGWYFSHVQDDLNLLILHMLRGTFLLNAA